MTNPSQELIAFDPSSDCPADTFRYVGSMMEGYFSTCVRRQPNRAVLGHALPDLNARAARDSSRSRHAELGHRGHRANTGPFKRGAPRRVNGQETIGNGGRKR